MKLMLFKLFPCVLNSVDSMLIAKINNSSIFFTRLRDYSHYGNFILLLLSLVSSLGSILTAFATEEKTELSHDCNGQITSKLNSCLVFLSVLLFICWIMCLDKT